MRILYNNICLVSSSLLKFTDYTTEACGVNTGCADCNKEENILSWQRFLKPQILFGVPFEEMIGGWSSSSHMVKTLVTLYAKEQYILVVNQCQQPRDLCIFISFKVGATNMSVLRSIWQAYWLHENWGRSEHVFVQLKESIWTLEERFDDFLNQLEGAGWDTKNITIRVPKELVIEEMGPL